MLEGPTDEVDEVVVKESGLAEEEADSDVVEASPPLISTVTVTVLAGRVIVLGGAVTVVTEAQVEGIALVAGKLQGQEKPGQPLP